MRRLIVIATLSFLALPATAQRGGGHGGMGARADFASHVSMGHADGHFTGGGSTSHGSMSHTGERWHHTRGWRFHHHGFVGRRWGYGYYGYPWGPSFYDPRFADYSYSEQPYYPVDMQAAYYAQVEQRLDRIEDRLDRMLDRLDTHGSAPPEPAQPSKPESTPTATLVFRDGHSEQIQNYAIVGNTLWVFTEDHARKIPIAQINTDATERANEQRGIDLHVPKG